MSPKKILIFGFPHCGTTIMRNIMGHIPDVEEVLSEGEKIPKEILRKCKKKFIVLKYPFINGAFFNPEYSDFIKIIMIRNPLWVFSSFNKRFLRQEFPGCTVQDYINNLRQFNKYKDGHREDIIALRYEDIFPNNYQRLREIYGKIGLEYTDEIFNNEKYKNYVIGETHQGIKYDYIPEEKPDNHSHRNFRTWQVNQKFRNMNDESKIKITPMQKSRIINDKDIIAVYPEVVEIINRVGTTNEYK